MPPSHTQSIKKRPGIEQGLVESFMPHLFQSALLNTRVRTIVDEMITTAARPGIISLTKGFETKKQFDSLKETGSRLYQGDSFAKPMQEEDFGRYLTGTQSRKE